MKYIKKQSNRWLVAGGLFALLLTSQFMLPALVGHSSAATMAKTFVRFDRMSTSTATTGTVCASPGTSSTDVKTWEVTFPTGYTVSTTGSNWQTTNISTTNLSWPAGAVAWPNATSATASATSQTVTWTNASAQTMNTGSIYCYNWTASAALTTKSSAADNNLGTVVTKDSSPATIDSGTYATSTVSNDSIAVSASIDQSFSMVFSSNSDSLGTLTTGSVANSQTPRTITVNTNAKNGWVAWAKDSNTGLNSSAASYTISSTGVGSASQNLSAGTEGYNLGVAYSQSTGTCTSGSAVAANFDGASSKGGGLDSSLRAILSCGGTSAGGVITLTNHAAINGATPAAADYQDTETFVAGGIF
jgi:hypothetical protein